MLTFIVEELGLASLNSLKRKKLVIVNLDRTVTYLLLGRM